MNEDEFFDTQFPNAARPLRHLRTQDEEFDKICRDYREIFGELAFSSDTNANPQSRYLADLAETLSDLRTSIEAQLAGYTDSRAPKIEQGETK